MTIPTIVRARMTPSMIAITPRSFIQPLASKSGEERL